MARCLVSAIMLALIAAHVAAAEEDLPAQIKPLQKERVKLLTELLEIRTAQYNIGAFSIEYLHDAMTDLGNAQLDAADKPEDRIAVLEEGVKRETDFLKIVQARFDAGTVTKADVRQAQSCLLDVRIRLLRERGPNDKVVAQIKAAQKERVKVLTELVEIRTAQVKAGTLSRPVLLGAEADLVNAQIDATDKHEDRVALLEQAVKREAEFLNVAEARQTVTQATDTQADVYRARSLVLTTKIGLLKEGSPNDKVATQIKALQKEQIEALTQLVKLVEDEYRKGAAELWTFVFADTALFNAQLDAADKSEDRIAAMEEGVKRETDFLKIVEARINAGTITEADVRQTRSCLLDSKVRLLRERGAEYINRGNEWENKGEYDKAVAAYTQALAVAAPDDTQDISIAHANRGGAWANKREYDKAIADYTQALAITPNDADSYYGRGIARYSKGEYDKAIADFDQALAVNPKYANAYSARGGAWGEKHEYDKAIADYNQALAINPKYAIAYSGRGGAWGEKHEYDKAIADYNQALAINPNDAVAYSNRGETYRCMGEYEKAIADCNRALAINPNNADAYSNRGNAYQGKGEYDKAIADYNQALTINPKYATAYSARGKAYQGKGEYDKAIADCNQALRSIPNTPMPIAIAPKPGRIRGNTTRPLPIATKPYDSIPKTPTLTLISVGFTQLAPIRNTVMEKRL